MDAAVHGGCLTKTQRCHWLVCADVSPLYIAPRRLGGFEGPMVMLYITPERAHLITNRSRFLALRLKLCLAFLPITTSTAVDGVAFRDHRLALAGDQQCRCAALLHICADTSYRCVVWSDGCVSFAGVLYGSRTNRANLNQLTSLELAARPSPPSCLPLPPDRHIGSSRRSWRATASQRLLAGRPPSSG